MLLSFRVANVRSLRDEQELSFVVPAGEKSDVARVVKLSDGKTVDVYPLVGVFGANASFSSMSSRPKRPSRARSPNSTSNSTLPYCPFSTPLTGGAPTWNGCPWAMLCSLSPGVPPDRLPPIRAGFP